MDGRIEEQKKKVTINHKTQHSAIIIIMPLYLSYFFMYNLSRDHLAQGLFRRRLCLHICVSFVPSFLSVLEFNQVVGEDARK